MRRSFSTYSLRISNFKFVCFCIILASLSICIVYAEDNLNPVELKIDDDIESLYSELNQIEGLISKSLRRAQLLKRIESSLNDTSEAIDSSSIHIDEYKPTPTKTQSNNRVNNILKKNYDDVLSKSHSEEVSLSNNFFEKIVIEANSTELVKFKLMRTPLFVDKYYDDNAKVMVAIHSDGILGIWNGRNEIFETGIYSINTGNLIDLFDLNQSIAEIKDYNITQQSIDWTTDVVEFQTESYGEYMRIIILTVHGNCFIFDLKVKRVKRQTSSDMAPEIVSESLNIILSYGFNVWNTIIDSNSTKYSEEINTLLQQGLTPVSISHDGEFISGTYTIGDNKGYFSIIKKDEDRTEKNSYSFTFLIRSYSDFDHLDLVTSQYYLTLFTSNDKFSFIRSFDGKVSTTQCNVENSEIIGVTFDQSQQGGYFITTKSGEIYIFLALQKVCEMIGKISAEANYLNNIKALNKILVTYDSNTGEFCLFDLNKFKSISGIVDLSNIHFQKIKPNYPKVYEQSSDSKFKARSLDLDENPSETGYDLLIRVPGTSNKVLLFDLITHEYEETPWYNMPIENKGEILLLLIALVIFINVSKFSSSRARYNNQYNLYKKKLNRKKSEEERQLEELSRRLQNFENDTKDLGSLSKNFNSASKE